MLLRRYHDAKTVEVKPVEEEKTSEAAKVEAAPEAEETKTRRKRKS